jgi:hypothetical protein
MVSASLGKLPEPSPHLAIQGWFHSKGRVGLKQGFDRNPYRRWFRQWQHMTGTHIPAITVGTGSTNPALIHHGYCITSTMQIMGTGDPNDASPDYDK